MKYAYEPSLKGQGYYHCEKCEVVVQHTGYQNFEHTKGCPNEDSGIDTTTYHFSSLEVKCLNKWKRPIIGRLNEAIIKDQFPELVGLSFPESE